MSGRIAQIPQVAASPVEVAAEAIRKPRLLDQITAGVSADEAGIRFGSAKALCIISERRPDLLYSRFDFFVRMLDCKNKILQWNAIQVISHLASVDTEHKFTAIFDKYFSHIGGPAMITAANVVRGGAQIARAKPHLADRIATEVLKVSTARYQTPECRKVAIGHAILALGDFLDLIQNRAPVLRFVQKQLNNSRPATRKKAEQFLKRVRGRQ